MPEKQQEISLIDDMQNLQSKEPKKSRELLSSLYVRESLVKAGYSDKVQVILMRFNRLLDEQGWSHNHAASQVPHGARNNPISTTTVSQLLNGKYPSPLSVCLSIEKFMQRYEERALLADAGYVSTRLSRDIHQICDWAAMNQSFAGVYGLIQSGKTTALEAFTRTYKKSTAVYFATPMAANFAHFVRSFAKAVGVRTTGPSYVIREAIYATVTSSNVILIDELHQVFTTYPQNAPIRVLEWLREVQYRCQCGMVLSGTPTLKNEINGGQFADLFQQLVQRSPMWLDTSGGKTDGTIQKKDYRPGFGPGGTADLHNIAEAFGLDKQDQDQLKFCAEIVKYNSTGRLFAILKAGKNRATKEGHEVTWDDVNKAHETITALN